MALLPLRHGTSITSRATTESGRYTKHIYIGSQRIVSKLGDFASYGSDPRRIPYAGSEADAVSVDYKGKYASQQQVIKDNYATFNVPYNGEDNNDYVDGEGFCCNDGTSEAAQEKVMTRSAIDGNFKPNDDYEKMQFYYHPDHLGSSSYITNLDGEVAQHIEYVPFGEVFIEERNNTWNTPYLFNAKEFDEETGMYYYGARYYEPRLSLWISVDPMEEKYPNIGGYVYCVNNPVKFVDLDGRDWILSVGNRAYWYGGKVGNKKHLMYTFKATSGYKGLDTKGTYWNLQKAKYQNVRNGGPTAEGTYHINLKPDPNRVAETDTKTGALKKNPSGGIEKIPDFVENPNKRGYGWTYEEWGKNRASLTPDKVTGATNEERDNNSYYFHDSQKGYSHGCTEVETELFNKLNDYRKAGHDRIDVIVKYPGPNHSTNGGTKKNEKNK